MPDTKPQPFQQATSNYGASLMIEGVGEQTSDEDEYLLYNGKDLPPKSFPNGVPTQGLADSMIDSNNGEDYATLEVLRRRRIESILRLSSKLPRQDAFVLLQKWECVVTEVREDIFLAHLKDLTSKGPDEEAEFAIEEIPPSDKSLLAPGAVFYWCIGYLDTRIGQRIRASEIRFRRFPAWTIHELERADSEAEQAIKLLDWK